MPQAMALEALGPYLPTVQRNDMAAKALLVHTQQINNSMS
jgi:hypothetical protein